METTRLLLGPFYFTTYIIFLWQHAFFNVIILLIHVSLNFSGNNGGDHDETDRLSVSKVFLKKSLIVD